MAKQCLPGWLTKTGIDSEITGDESYSNYNLSFNNKKTGLLSKNILY